MTAFNLTVTIKNRFLNQLPLTDSQTLFLHRNRVGLKVTNLIHYPTGLLTHFFIFWRRSFWFLAHSTSKSTRTLEPLAKWEFSNSLHTFHLFCPSPFWIFIPMIWNVVGSLKMHFEYDWTNLSFTEKATCRTSKIQLRCFDARIRHKGVLNPTRDISWI